MVSAQLQVGVYRCEFLLGKRETVCALTHTGGTVLLLMSSHRRTDAAANGSTASSRSRASARRATTLSRSPLASVQAGVHSCRDFPGGDYPDLMDLRYGCFHLVATAEGKLASCSCPV